MIQAFGTMGVWLAAVFVSAGRLDWIRGWSCVTLYIITMVAAGVLVRRVNPSLLEARAKWRRKDTKPFDKIFLSIYLPSGTTVTVSPDCAQIWSLLELCPPRQWPPRD